MDKPKVTAKDFFLWAGAMVAFYWTVMAYIYLVFDYINYAFPSALTTYPIDPYQSGISYEIASVIVLLPLYVFLMWIIRKDIAGDSTRREIWVRRWALIFTLFIAGITIAIDLITLLTTFLNGEMITTAFLLKVLIIFLIAAGVFMHFIADLKGYWEQFPLRQRSIGSSVAVLAAVTIIAGFFIVGTPAQARLARFDEQKVSDLQDIQSRITSYWQAKRQLPLALANLSDPLSYGPLPADPQTGESYIYQKTGILSFKLCATFNVPTQPFSVSNNPSRVMPMTPYAPGSPADTNWVHGAGQICFERTIDSSFYPPLSK
ncbi:MAG: DUF5671 domain-containing protein [Minisyncoccota bacterium]